jgi:hypothetical protein
VEDTVNQRPRDAKKNPKNTKREIEAAVQPQTDASFPPNSDSETDAQQPERSKDA